MFQLITYNSEVTELIFIFRADDTETNMFEMPSAPCWFPLKGTTELLKFSLTGNVRLGDKWHITTQEKWVNEVC